MITINLAIDKSIFNDIYLPYVTDYSHRYEVYKGSAGSGKSYYLTQKLLIKALSSKRKVLVMRKVGASIRDSVWDLFIEVLQQFQIYDKCKINKSDFKIELPNNSIFLFKGLDDREKIKSITGITDIFCEECTEFDKSDIIQLNLRLRAKAPNLQMFFAFNPIAKENYTYSYFKYNECEEYETIPIREYDNTIIFNTTYKNNKFLDKQYIASLEELKETSPYDYTVYALGRFANLGKLVYPNHQIMEFDWREILKKPNTKAIFGLDFGYINDPSALVFAIYSEDEKRIYIYDEIYQKGLLNNELAGLIIQKGIAKEIIIADCAERKSIDEIKKYGVSRIRPCRKGKGSILQGVQKIQQSKIIIHPNCTNAITEIRNYTWKKDKSTDEFVNEIEDSYNHLMDALRYSIQSIKAKANILTIRL